jgi:hypothetical protein
MRLEGKDYIVQDGDIIHFRFNVWLKYWGEQIKISIFFNSRGIGV